ncbi:hypothetical protein GCM10022261_12480 [Brevibacterium daeguense]|uniref:Uncharacterized protein n=1 Tax=Brevibacterium daeguense TaxID=909936 RepID=A0ABP8EIE3_9MICO|nr:hypothetical protein [Brevibacterium daeguense]
MDKPRGQDSFGWAYKVGFWFQYIIVHIVGPATTNDNRDPRVQLKREYERRRQLHENWLESQSGNA